LKALFRENVAKAVAFKYIASENGFLLLDAWHLRRRRN
jgi:hypothetical protein